MRARMGPPHRLEEHGGVYEHIHGEENRIICQYCNLYKLKEAENL